jgi:hypothetical protein
MNAQGVFRDDSAWPDAVHQFDFGDKVAARLGQNFEYLKGTPANRDRRSKNPKFAAGKVNLAFARRVNRSIARSEHVLVHFRNFVSFIQNEDAGKAIPVSSQSVSAIPRAERDVGLPE